GADRPSRGISFLYLAEDLRLAKHHGIEACGHTKYVPNRILLAIFIEMPFKLVEIELEIIAEESPQVPAPVLQVRDQFHPVAGREDHSLFNPRVLCELPARLRQTPFRYGQPLTYLHGRAVVIYADQLEFHVAANL